MVLVQTPKRPRTMHEKKRHGHHHKQSKDYAKHYWPYLPVAMLVAAGWISGAALSAHHTLLFASTSANGRQLANNLWLTLACLGIASLCSALFLYKHGRLWYRALRFSEAFVNRHPFLDIALVALGVSGFVLASVSGV